MAEPVLTIAGYKVDFPFSCPDVRVRHPDGRESILFPVYDSEYEFDEAATIARASRFVDIVRHRKART